MWNKVWTRVANCVYTNASYVLFSSFETSVKITHNMTLECINSCLRQYMHYLISIKI